MQHYVLIVVFLNKLQIIQSNQGQKYIIYNNNTIILLVYFFENDLKNVFFFFFWDVYFSNILTSKFGIPWSKV